MIELFALWNDRVELIQPSRAKQRQFVWARCLQPSDEELEAVAQTTKIPLDDLKQITNEEVPRVEAGKYLLVVYKAPFYAQQEITVTSLAVFLRQKYLVTVEREKVRVTEDLATKLKKNQRRFVFKRGYAYFLYYLLDNINDEFLSAIDKIGDASELLKQQLGQFNKQSIERIYTVNNTLIHFNQALIGNMGVLHSLRKSYFRLLAAKDRENFSDLYYDTMQLIDTQRIQRGLISSWFNLQSVMNDYKLNQFMKRITSLALIIMIPTLITGIYGMNFIQIPLADSPYGFYVLVGSMFGFLVFALYIFHKLGWV